jgi:hypothetical protein
MNTSSLTLAVMESDIKQEWCSDENLAGGGCDYECKVNIQKT